MPWVVTVPKSTKSNIFSYYLYKNSIMHSFFSMITVAEVEQNYKAELEAEQQ